MRRLVVVAAVANRPFVRVDPAQAARVVPVVRRGPVGRVDPADRATSVDPATAAAMTAPDHRPGAPASRAFT